MHFVKNRLEDAGITYSRSRDLRFAVPIVEGTFRFYQDPDTAIYSVGLIKAMVVAKANRDRLEAYIERVKDMEGDPNIDEDPDMKEHRQRLDAARVAYKGELAIIQAYDLLLLHHIQKGLKQRDRQKSQ